jgi:hypothetical protein
VIEIVRVLVDAGATHASAARAAVILDRGGSISEARDAIVLAETVEVFDPAVLLAVLDREQVAR